MVYSMKVRRRLLWKTYRNLTSHKLQPDQDKMELFFIDGSVLILGQWSKYDYRLGNDWVAYVKTQIKKEAGQE